MSTDTGPAHAIDGSTEPVLTRTAITAAVTSVASIAATFGLHIGDTDQQWAVTGIVAAISIAHLLSSLHARTKVTPLANPKTADGKRLVPAVEPVVSDAVEALDDLTHNQPTGGTT